LTLIRFANALLDRGEEAYVRQHLYDSAGPGRSRSVIKNDLEFVAHYWEVSNFDLWEETKGHHFYTRLAQYRSLIDGAKLAQRLGDAGAAGFYQNTARAIAGELELHWSAERGQIDATRFQRPGREYKSSQLDMAVVLGSLHSDTTVAAERFFAPSDPRVLATALKIENRFQSIYGVNTNRELGTAIGRYPEDIYNGVGESEGNPWFLTTLAMAEMYYQAANEWESDGEIVLTDLHRQIFSQLGLAKVQAGQKSLKKGSAEFAAVLADFRARGDAFVARTRAHMDQESGAMAEQFHRHSGFQQGARDLTWSYAAFVTAVRARNRN
jgi:glucoamylase